MNTTSTKLTPVLVSNLIEAGDAAFDGQRRRPVAAYNGEQAVVCSARTARRHGWVVVGKLYKRVH